MDERKIRITQRLAREQEAERMMAAQPLQTENNEPEIPQRAVAAASYANTRSAAESTGDERTAEESHPDVEQESKDVILDTENEGSPQTWGMKGGDDGNIRELLQTARTMGDLMPPVVDTLEDFLDEGIERFNREQLLEGLDYSPRQADKVISNLKELGIIFSSHRAGKKMMYGFAHIRDRPRKTNGYSKELIGTLQSLAHSENSLKDKRLGGMLLEKLGEGVVSEEDYIRHGWESRWASDMRLAEQMGLVAKISPDEFMICENPENDYGLLLPAQKAFASAIYQQFGGEIFSLEMVVATLDYSSSHASAVLHQFTLLKILDCRKDDVNRYQFLITPEKHPECFAAYKARFRLIEFAVYCRDYETENYNTFREKLAEAT